MKRFLILSWAVWVTSSAMAIESNRSEAEIEYEASPMNFGLELQYGMVEYGDYTLTGNERISQFGQALRLAFEWIPFQEIGKVGLGFGAGVFGLKNANISGGRAATIVTIPVEIFVSYRFDYVQDQLFVPFARIGPKMSWVRQTSNFGLGVPGSPRGDTFDYAFGLEICLNRIDSSAARELDHSFGINNTYFMAEYGGATALNGDTRPNLSNEAIRLGLRFEM